MPSWRWQRSTTASAETAPVRGLGRISTMSKVFVDTNILAYTYDSGSPAKQEAARRALRENHDFVVSTQVLLELSVVLTQKLTPPLSLGDAEAAVRQVGKLEVVNADRVLVEQAMATAAAHQISLWDSMIIEAAREAACGELWTEDLATGATLRGVRVVNPLI